MVKRPGSNAVRQPRTQACSRYPSDQRRLGTERDRRIFPTSLTGNVTSEISEDDWERGWKETTFGLARFHPRTQRRRSFGQRSGT